MLTATLLDLPADIPADDLEQIGRLLIAEAGKARNAAASPVKPTETAKAPRPDTCCCVFCTIRRDIERRLAETAGAKPVETKAAANGDPGDAEPFDEATGPMPAGKPEAPRAATRAPSENAWDIAASLIADIGVFLRKHAPSKASEAILANLRSDIEGAIISARGHGMAIARNTIRDSINAMLDAPGKAATAHGAD